MGILGVILGILAVLCALLATFLFGTTGTVIAVVLAAAAIILAVVKRSKDKKGGIPAIVIAVFAVILAFSMSSAWSKVFSDMHKTAVEFKPDGLWAQASEDSSGGLFGIIKKLPQDEASLNALVQEMNELNKVSN
ncbi:MAG: hypothetical protein IJ246_02415 [Clostridia bacterium]|nr:hypothetical protein [Clostridia bacterium]